MDFQLYNYNDAKMDNMYNWINMVIAGGLGVILAYLITDYMGHAEETNLAKIKELEARIQSEIDDYNELVDKYDDLYDQKDKIEKENAQNIEDYNQLVTRHNNLLDENTELEEKIETLEDRIEVLESRLRRNIIYKIR
jgi:predicted nuclease with TOPRIM domain